MSPGEVFGKNSDKNQFCRIRRLHRKESEVEAVLRTAHDRAQNENQREQCDDADIEKNQNPRTLQKIIVGNACKKKDAHGNDDPDYLLIKKRILRRKGMHRYQTKKRYCKGGSKEKTSRFAPRVARAARRARASAIEAYCHEPSFCGIGAWTGIISTWPIVEENVSGAGKHEIGIAGIDLRARLQLIRHCVSDAANALPAVSKTTATNDVFVKSEYEEFCASAVIRGDVVRS